MSRVEIVKGVFAAFAAGDRAVVERVFAREFRFSSPLDVGLDRAGYFERCWPGSGRGQRFEFVRVLECGEEVVVTYEMEGAEGRRGRNTEVFGFRGEEIGWVEVYFGWSVG